MKTRLTLRPGQNGTKKLRIKYGDRLLAVRYRYDAEARLRIKTVELIEEELPWDPPLPAPEANAPVLLRVGWEERSLQQSIKAAGGTWLPERKLWQLSYRLVQAMGLEARVVP
jgi:hypothetical protein